MYSLKKTLTRNLLLNLLLVMLGLLVIVYFSMQQVLTNYILTRLQHDADSLISALEQGRDGQWQVEPTQLSTVYDRVRSGHYYRIQIDQQRITSRSLFDSEFPQQEITQSPSHYTALGPAAETWLIWQQQVSKRGHTISIWIAEDISPFERHMIIYTSYALLLILALSALLILLQQRTLDKSFRVFESLRRNMAQIRLQQLGDSGIDPPLEIMPLVDEIERLVQQLQSRIQRTRHSISNLAHELKRPIQLLTIQQEQHAELSEPLEQIRSIVDRELRRARISGSQSSAVEFNPGEELRHLAQVMKAMYPTINIDISAPGHNGAVRLDRDDMLELIGNILDNSCKYAKRQVNVHIDIDAQQLSMTFEDDGSGLEQAQIEQIRQRGVRLDETRAGHGIGLSLCQDIVDSYQGEIRYSRAELGGLRVTLHIPYFTAQ